MFFFEDIDFSNIIGQGELQKAVNDYTKDLEPPLPKADEMNVGPPQTGDDKMEVVETQVAKNDAIEPLVRNDKETEPLLSETELEQPSVTGKNELDDVEPPLENKENFERVENTLAKDNNLEHPLTEPGNQDQAEPATVRRDTIAIQSPLAKSDDREHADLPLGRKEDTATAGMLCIFDIYIRFRSSSSTSYFMIHTCSVYMV